MKRIFRKITAVVLMSCVLATGLTACGKPEATAIAATIGDTEISYGFVNFYSQLIQVYYDSFYSYYYGDNFWSTDVSESGDGSETMETSTREQIKEDIEKMYRLRDHAADYNIEFTDEEKALAKEAAAKFIEDNNDAAIKKMTATEDIVAEYLELSTISSRVEDAIREETELTVTEEEAACRTFSYVEIDLSGTYDEEGNFVEYTDDEIEAATASGDAFCAEAAKAVADGAASGDAAETDNAEADVTASGDAEATESGDPFETVASNYGYTVSTYSYNEGDDGMDSAVLEAADALSEGEVSPVIKVSGDDEDSLYILRLDSEYDESASASKLSELQEEQKDEHYEDIYKGFQEESEFKVVDSVWNAVPFEGLYETESNEDDTTSIESSDAIVTESGDVISVESSDAISTLSSGDAVVAE